VSPRQYLSISLYYNDLGYQHHETVTGRSFHRDGKNHEKKADPETGLVGHDVFPSQKEI
jgi:hypothetical protein